MLRRASISTWSRSAHPQYSTITDYLCSRVATPPRPPCLSLSLCLCMNRTVNCTAVRGGRLLNAPAERGKTPAWSPVLGSAHSSGPQVAVVSWSARLNASRQTLTRTRHTMTQLTHFVGHTPDVLAWHRMTASPQTFAYAIKPACRVFWTTSIASCRSFANLLITCMHPRTFLRARK